MFIVQSGNIVRKATSDDADPTPGYLFIEMAKLSNKDHSMCEGLMNSLLDRLGNNSLFVKMKAMRCIKHLVKEGNPHFRSSLQRHAEQMRPYVTISGAPDPRYGDSLYTAIRADASEVIDLLYRPVVQRQSALNSVSSSSSSYSSGSSIASRSMSSADSIYASVAGGNTSSQSSSSSFQSRFQRDGGGGGGLTNFGPVPGGQARYSRTQPEERPPVQPTAAQSNLARGIFGGSTSNESSALLASLLDPSKGSTVSSGPLQAFVQQLKTEGPDSVASAVKSLDSAARSATNPAMQMRILCVIQGMAEGGAAGSNEFAPLTNTLVAWKSSPVFAVRNKAQTVTTAIHNAVVSLSSASAQTAPAPAASSQIDLLGLGMSAPAPQQQPAPAPAAADPLSDLLFGGGNSAPKQQPTSTGAGGLDDLLGFSSTPQKPAPAPASTSFDFISSAPMTSTAPATNSGNALSFDLMSGSQNAAPSSTTTSSSTFDFITGAAPVPKPAASSSSTFDFISGPQNSAPAPKPAASSSSSFDFISGGQNPAPAAQPQTADNGGDLFSGLSMEDGNTAPSSTGTTTASSSSFDFISGDISSSTTSAPSQSNQSSFDLLSPSNAAPAKNFVPPSRISADAFKFDENDKSDFSSFDFTSSSKPAAPAPAPAPAPASTSVFDFTQPEQKQPAPQVKEDNEPGAFDGLSSGSSAFSFI